MKILFYSLFFISILSACTESTDPKTLFDEAKYDKSLPLWTEQADNGDALSQNYVGIHYYLGLGTVRNYKLAKDWFEKSAKQGFSDAQYNLAVMYENGEYVKKDYIIAAMWYSLAIEGGNEHARNRMQSLLDDHILFPNQYKQAKELAKEYK